MKILRKKISRKILVISIVIIFILFILFKIRVDINNLYMAVVNLATTNNEANHVKQDVAGEMQRENLLNIILSIASPILIAFLTGITFKLQRNIANYTYTPSLALMTLNIYDIQQKEFVCPKKRIPVKFTTEEEKDYADIIKRELQSPYYEIAEKTDIKKEFNKSGEFEIFLSASGIEKEGIFLNYNVHSYNHIFEMFLLSCQPDNPDLKLYERATVVRFDNLSIPIKNLNLNSLEIQFNDTSIGKKNFENTKKSVSYNRAINRGKPFFLILKEVYDNECFLLCNRQGLPKYEKLVIEFSMQNIHGENYFFEATITYAASCISMNLKQK